MSKEGCLVSGTKRNCFRKPILLGLWIFVFMILEGKEKNIWFNMHDHTLVVAQKLSSVAHNSKKISYCL